MREKAPRQHTPRQSPTLTRRHEAHSINAPGAAADTAQPTLTRLQQVIGNRAVAGFLGKKRVVPASPAIARNTETRAPHCSVLQRAPAGAETQPAANEAVTVTHHNALLYSVAANDGKTASKKKKRQKASPEATGQQLPFGAKVKVGSDSVRDGKWLLVHAQQVDDKGSPTGLGGWVRDFNLSNYAGELVASQGMTHVLSPDPILAEEEIAAKIGALNDDGINLVIQAINDAAKTINKSDYGGGNEEKGADRSKLVESIGNIRAMIQGLTARSTGDDSDVLRRVQAYLYRSLAKMNPFYTQGQNANILYKTDPSKEASARTCNVTCISMTLEGLGKTAKDFNGNQALLAAIAHQFEGALSLKQGDAFDTLTRLRLPDFLQLVAIYIQIKGDERGKALSEADSDESAFAARIKVARSDASGAITRANNFDEFVSAFNGVSLVGRTLPQYAETLAIYGEKVKGAKDNEWLTKGEKASASKVATLTARVAALEESLPKLTGKKAAKAEKDLKKARAELVEKQEKQSAYSTGGSAAEREQYLPAVDYRDVVLPIMLAELSAGNQIVANLHNHFTRLEAVYKDRVVVDDPGGSERVNKVMTWAEARDFGYFKRYSVVSGK